MRYVLLIFLANVLGCASPEVWHMVEVKETVNNRFEEDRRFEKLARHNIKG